MYPSDVFFLFLQYRNLNISSTRTQHKEIIIISGRPVLFVTQKEAMGTTHSQQDNSRNPVSLLLAMETTLVMCGGQSLIDSRGEIYITAPTISFSVTGDAFSVGPLIYLTAEYCSTNWAHHPLRSR